MSETTTAQSGNEPYLLPALAAITILTGIGTLFAFSHNRAVSDDCDRARKQLASMQQKKKSVIALRAAIESQSPRTENSNDFGPLIPFLEEEANRKNLVIRGIYQRPSIEKKQTILNRIRRITEQQTEIQVGEGSMSNLAFFLHSFETQRPNYFVKELSGLAPNQGRGDNWRVRVILSRITVNDE